MLRDALLAPRITEPLISAARIAQRHAILLRKDRFYFFRTQRRHHHLKSWQLEQRRIMSSGLTSPHTPPPLNLSHQQRLVLLNLGLAIPALLKTLHQTFNHHHAAAPRRLIRVYPQLALRISKANNSDQSFEPCHSAKQDRSPHYTKSGPPNVKLLDKVVTEMTGFIPETKNKNKYARSNSGR